MCKTPSRRIRDCFMMLPVDIANHPDWIRVYDFENQIIWENTSRADDAKILRIEPKRK